jgi:hypothetical protein
MALHANRFAAEGALGSVSLLIKFLPPPASIIPRAILLAQSRPAPQTALDSLAWAGLTSGGLTGGFLLGSQCLNGPVPNFARRCVSRVY